MICLYSGDSCEGAKVYYYDYLGGEGIAEVPVLIQEHVKHCVHCLGQIGHLAQLLAEPREEESGRGDLMTELLALHFSHLCQEVTCAAAKPFIPTLADPTLPIRVTTPITQHIQQCAACRQELEMLRTLGLTGRQLYRIGQFLADPALNTDLPMVAEWGDCVADLRPERLTAAQCKQVCLSPQGRARIRVQRQVLADQQTADAGHDRPHDCEGIGSSDLFEYALPYHGEGGVSEDSGAGETLAEHIRSCPDCLKRLQSLQEALFGLAERADSEVVTIMRPEETKPVSRRSHRNREALGGADAVWYRGLYPWLRAMAAVLVLGLGIAALTRIPRATAVEYEQMHSALSLVSGIHMTTVQATDGAVVQEVWGVPGQGQWLLSQNGSAVLWDLNREKRVYWNKQTNALSSDDIPPGVLQGLKSSQASLFGMLPAAGRFPAGARWENGPEDGSDGSANIRRLIIPQMLPGGEKGWQKRIYHLDTVRNLPLALEFYGPVPGGTTLVKKTVTSVRYPEDLDLIQQAEALGLAAIDTP